MRLECLACCGGREHNITRLEPWALQHRLVLAAQHCSRDLKLAPVRAWQQHEIT
eukprot:COSAG06_NODE_39322_length_414_cov_0.577778_2_plen_53_part_01